MSRIAARFADLEREGRAGLVTFLESHDPDRESSAALLRGLPEAGADLIELGMPFTDPMADGPSVQAAGLRGLAAGATVGDTLALVRGFREVDAETPVLAYGTRRFCADAAGAGVDGLILVDLPTEEADLLAADAEANGLDIIRLVAPTTDAERLPVVLQQSSGFVYYVSITGITGTRSASAADLAAALPRIRTATRLPIAIGFGVRTPEQAAAAARVADAAVVGSALCDTLAASLDANGRAQPDTVRLVLDQVRALAHGVRNARAKAA